MHPSLSPITFPHTPAPGSHSSTFSLYESCNICCFVFGLFHLHNDLKFHPYFKHAAASFRISFIHEYTFDLFWAFGCYENTVVHTDAQIFQSLFAFFFCINAWRWNCWMTWKFCDQLFEEPHFNAISLSNIKQWILIKNFKYIIL